MDPELKASMDNILRMATSRPAPESTPESVQLSEMELKRQDQARKKAQEREQWCLAGIPSRFYPVLPESIDPEIWGLCEKEESLFLHGPPGTGKTHLAVALLKDRGARWESFITFASLLMELRNSFKDSAEKSEWKIIKHYSSVCPFVLDDLGAEKTSEFALQSLYIIIDNRYSGMYPTIITSNLSVDEIADKVGDRIASRIAGMCKVIELKGKDRRIT